MHTVALVVYPSFQSMSLAVSSVFECANLLYGEPIYVFTLVSEEGGGGRVLRRFFSEYPATR